MNTDRVRIGLLPFLLIFGMVLNACGGKPMPALTHVTVQLRWTHQAQFAGFYAADQNGYYAEEGLSVSFLEGGPNVELVQPVVDGMAQFGVTNADGLLLARSMGQNVQAIATIYRRSPTVYFTLAESGITRPQDFVGRRIRVVRASAPIFHAMMANVGIAPGQYTEVNVPANLEPLYAGEVDVSSGYVTNEVLTARAAGYELNLIFPDDYGIHFYADTVFTTDDLIASEPNLVLRFLHASLKGWTYAVEHPTEVGAWVLKYNLEGDADLENEKMITSIPLVNTGEDFIGWMKPELWAGMERTLREQGVLTEPLDVTQVYTMQFIEEIYDR